MASNEDLKRRLRILEGALGINLDTSGVCSGDPCACPADPCDVERCPMRNNLVQQMYRSYTALQRKADITEQVVEELCDAGVVTQEMLRRAKLRVEHSGIICEMHATEEALKQCVGQAAVEEVLNAKLSRLQARFVTIERELD